jgi:hypothetical protein
MNKEAKKYRILGIIFLTTFLILIINWHSKAEYLSPAYPLIYAGGGLFIEKIFSGKSFGWVKYALIILIVITGIISMPMAIPILPVNNFICYSSFLGISHQNSEHKQLADLPQFYADMFGWEDLAKTVSSVYKTIPDSEKSTTIVFAGNYGEAGSLEYYSSKYEMPPVVCPHNAYWYWTKPDEKKVKTIIVIGGNKEELQKIFTDVTPATVHKTKYSMPYENNLPVFICRGILKSLKEIWQHSKNFS